jgi:hypothetical protein
MASIRTEGGVLETEAISPRYDPHFCGKCGGRLGWIDTGISDAPVSFCDECIRQITEDGDDED